jgi:hypothetical protein
MTRIGYPRLGYARLAGLLYLIDVITAGIAPVHVLPRLVEQGDPVGTLNNIAASPWLLHLAVAGDLVTLVCEVAICALFYVLLRPVDRNLALLMAAFRLVYTGMVVANVSHLYAPLRLLADAPQLAGLSTQQRAAMTTLALDSYHDGFIIAMLFFAVHILLLGVLLFRSGYVRRALGVWLVLGSLPYFAYSLGNLTIPGVQVPLAVVAPGALAELTLALLLLFNRVRPRQAQQTQPTPVPA